MSETFNIHGIWRVIFQGKLVRATWTEKGPAEACLSLLKRGLGEITPTGSIKWDAKRIK